MEETLSKKERKDIKHQERREGQVRDQRIYVLPGELYRLKNHPKY